MQRFYAMDKEQEASLQGHVTVCRHREVQVESRFVLLVTFQPSGKVLLDLVGHFFE